MVIKGSYQLTSHLALMVWVNHVLMAVFAVEQRVCVLGGWLFFIFQFSSSRADPLKRFVLEGVSKACKMAWKEKLL